MFRDGTSQELSPECIRPASSSLASIVERTSGWTVVLAAIIGVVGYGLGKMLRDNTDILQISDATLRLLLRLPSTFRRGSRLRAVLSD